MAKEAIVEKTPPAKPEGRAGSLAKQGLISDKAMAKLNAKKKTAKPAEELAPAPKPAAKKVDVEIEGADENGDVTKGVKVPGGKVATTK